MAKNDNTISEEDYAKVVFEDAGELVVNLTSVEEAKFELIPKGLYDAVIDSWEFGNSENSGAPMFSAVFQLEHPDYSRVKLRSWFSFSPKALPFTKRSLNQFAKDVFGGPEGFNPRNVADSGIMIGRKVRLRVTHGEYEGQKQARVSDVLAPAGGDAGGSAYGGGKSGSKFF
jgi:hypothetical protein